MEIYLFNFAKKINSTKQPLLEDGTLYHGSLKDECSMLSPEVFFDFGIDAPAQYNYAYIPSFRRFYYISNWTFTRGRFLAVMSVDTLSSWRANILSSDEYVLRSASASDGSIVDSAYPTTSTINVVTEYADPSPWDTTKGVYVLGVISKALSRNTVGAVTYYVLGGEVLEDFMNFMLGNLNYLGVDFETISNMTEALLKAYYNPSQYISSCFWFPFEIFTNGSALLTFGFWQSSLMGGIPQASEHSLAGVIGIPKHPQAARGEYLNLAPFSKYTLNFRPFGCVPLDSSRLVGLNTITWRVDVDILTGVGVLTIEDDGGADILSIEAQVGVPIQISQIMRNYGGVLRNTIGAVGGIALGNYAGGMSGIGNAAESASPKISSTGSNGSRAEFKYLPNIVAEFTNVVDEDNTHLGKPLCKKRVLSTLSGYCQTYNSEIEIASTAQENFEINNYMNGGFYIE